jgi:hypothetical protein
MTDEANGQSAAPTTDHQDWDLYELLMYEQQNMHVRWIDNFRVILTFNSILLPGIVAIFLLLARADISSKGRTIAPFMLIILASVGILVTAVGAAFVSRLSSIATLRHNQIRHLENELRKSLRIQPFSEGQLLLDGKDKDLLSRREDALAGVRKPHLGKISGYFGYMLITVVFGASYLLLVLLVAFCL